MNLLVKSNEYRSLLLGVAVVLPSDSHFQKVAFVSQLWSLCAHSKFVYVYSLSMGFPN